MTTNAKFLVSAVALIAVAATPAMAKKEHARADRHQASARPQVEVVDDGLGPPGGRNFSPVAGPYVDSNICRAENGINCAIRSTRRILPDEICHCGQHYGAVLGPSQ